MLIGLPVRAGAGYENGSGYDDFIAPSLNFSEAVSSQNAETIYMRTHFTLEEVPSFDQLTLRCAMTMASLLI